MNKFSTSQCLGGVLFLIPCLFAIFAEYLVAGDANSQSLMHALEAPSASFWFGTDHLGRDMWLRLASGAKTSIFIALLSTLFAGCFGSLLGILSAQYPNSLDKVILFFANMTLALPGLLLVLLLAAISPYSLWPLFLGVALISSIEIYRVIRAQSMSIANSNSLAASRLLGFNLLYLLKRHYIPELKPLVLRLSAFAMATTILSVAALGFINVGVKPPRAELGLMMIELLPYYEEAPWALLQPIVVLFMLVFGLNLMVGKR